MLGHWKKNSEGKINAILNCPQLQSPLCPLLQFFWLMLTHHGYSIRHQMGYIRFWGSGTKDPVLYSSLMWDICLLFSIFQHSHTLVEQLMSLLMSIPLGCVRQISLGTFCSEQLTFGKFMYPCHTKPGECKLIHWSTSSHSILLSFIPAQQDSY